MGTAELILSPGKSWVQGLSQPASRLPASQRAGGRDSGHGQGHTHQGGGTAILKLVALSAVIAPAALAGAIGGWIAVAAALGAGLAGCGGLVEAKSLLAVVAC